MNIKWIVLLMCNFLLRSVCHGKSIADEHRLQSQGLLDGSQPSVETSISLGKNGSENQTQTALGKSTNADFAQNIVQNSNDKPLTSTKSASNKSIFEDGNLATKSNNSLKGTTSEVKIGNWIEANNTVPKKVGESNSENLAQQKQLDPASEKSEKGGSLDAHSAKSSSNKENVLDGKNDVKNSQEKGNEIQNINTEISIPDKENAANAQNEMKNSQEKEADLANEENEDELEEEDKLKINDQDDLTLKEDKSSNSKIEVLPEALPGDTFVNTPRYTSFFPFFLSSIVLLVVVYVVYHNKKKILGLIFEGRPSRRPSRRKYRKLDTEQGESRTKT